MNTKHIALKPTLVVTRRQQENEGAQRQKNETEVSVDREGKFGFAYTGKTFRVFQMRFGKNF